MKRPDINSMPAHNASSPSHSVAQRMSTGRYRVTSGYTLLELILVLAIMVIVSALTLPSISQSFQVHAVSKGADLFRAAMADARVKAIRSGKVHAVYYEPGGSFFNVDTLATAESQSQLAREQQQQIDRGADISSFGNSRLPRGVFFQSVRMEEDARMEQAIENAEARGNAGMEKLLFYPDGSSQNAVVMLQNQRGSFVQVVLRGLTGNSFAQRVDQPNGGR